MTEHKGMGCLVRFGARHRLSDVIRLEADHCLPHPAMQLLSSRDNSWGRTTAIACWWLQLVDPPLPGHLTPPASCDEAFKICPQLWGRTRRLLPHLQTRIVTSQALWIYIRKCISLPLTNQPACHEALKIAGTKKPPVDDRRLLDPGPEPGESQAA